MRRMERPAQSWIDPSALGRFEAGADPLADICGRARADRRGEVYTPTRVPLVRELPQVEASPTPASQGTAANYIIEANKWIKSGSAFKILMAVYMGGAGVYTLAKFRELTQLNPETTLKAIEDCIEGRYLERQSLCSVCDHPVEVKRIGEKDNRERIVTCPSCRREMSPKNHYRTIDPATGAPTGIGIFDTPVSEIPIPVSDSSIPPIGKTDTPVSGFPIPVSESPIPRLQESDTPVSENPIPSTGHSEASTPATNLKSRVERISRIGKTDTRLQNPDTRIGKTDTPRVRADSDSESNITNDSDSEYMRNGTRNGIGKSEIEQLAQASCKALETGTNSLGMHIKAWAHARQIDAKTGGKIHQTALQAILKELMAQRRETGQAQGKAWTRRVVDYFEGQGVPLITGRKS